MQLARGDIGRVLKRIEEEIPTVRRAVGLCSHEDAGVKGCEGGSIAEQEDERTGFVAALRGDLELGSSLEDQLPHRRIDTAASIEHARYRGHAYVRRGSDLFQPQTSLPWNAYLSHCAGTNLLIQSLGDGSDSSNSKSRENLPYEKENMNA